MLGFMPSEIARLVLGYLDELGCQQTKGQFLLENPHIQEYARCLEAGFQYPTTIEGKSLQAILQNYYLLTHSAKQGSNEQPDPTTLTNATSSSVGASTSKEAHNSTRSKEERLRKVLNKSRPDFKSKKSNTFTHLKSRHPLQSSLNGKHKSHGRCHFQETGNEACNSESETNLNDCPSVSAATSSLKKGLGFNTNHNNFTRTTNPIGRLPSDSSDTSGQCIEDNRASFIQSSVDQCTSPLSPFVFERQEHSTPKADVCDSVQTSKYSQASIQRIKKPSGHPEKVILQTVFQNDSPIECSNLHTNEAIPTTFDCGIPVSICTSNTNIYSRTKPIHNSTGHGSFKPLSNFGHDIEDYSRSGSPLNLAVSKKLSYSPKRNELMKEVKLEPEPVIPVIDLSSPEPSSEPSPSNNFLGVSSQDVQANVCPESIMNVNEVEVQLPHSHSPGASTKSSETAVALSAISNEKECLATPDRQNVLFSADTNGSEKGNVLPKETNNFKKPLAMFSSELSPVRHSPCHVSSTPNSPSVNLLSPSITPVNSVEPDLPLRYPETTSPRYILSQQRAKVSSLATPVKEYHQAVVNQLFSPKRKSQIPRRRLISSPSVHSGLQSEQMVDKEGSAKGNSTSDDFMDWAFLMELASSTQFHSILAENINKHDILIEMSPGKNDASQDHSMHSLQTSQVPTVHIPEDIVRDILNQTESNPECKGILERHCEKVESSRQKVAPSSDLHVSNMEESLNESILMEGNNKSVSSPRGDEKQCTEIVITESATTPSSTSSIQVANDTIVPIPTASVMSSDFLSTSVCTPGNPETINLPNISGSSVSGLPAVAQSAVSNSVEIITPNKKLRTILPSPKKDILKETLEFLDIGESPAKSADVTTAQQTASSEFGTCIQVFNQPIMSSKPANTFLVGGTALTPVKLNFPLSMLGFSQGQMYSSYLNGILQPVQDQSQQNDSNSMMNLPIFVTTAPKITTAVPKKAVHGLARRKNLKEKLIIQSARNPGLANTYKQKGGISQCHVRSLDFSNETADQEVAISNENTETTNVPVRTVAKTRASSNSITVAHSTEENSVITVDKTTNVSPLGQTTNEANVRSEVKATKRVNVSTSAKSNKIVCAKSTKVVNLTTVAKSTKAAKVETVAKSKVACVTNIVAKPVANRKRVTNTRAGAINNSVSYISSSGVQQQVSTIDLNQLDLLRDSSSASSSIQSPASTTPSSDTEAAAVTLMTLANKTFPNNKVRDVPPAKRKKDYTRVKSKTSQKCKKRKHSSEDGKSSKVHSYN